ncbi:Squamous cell carcinoma antigen recognized by T-cells 3 [Theileria parva strain Muguga]|uniref:RRM domain-containing protein n=1 Tax=Theileria parva TaxID=5875 RepID=Q4N143_THEPA|nr:Squamous cell carcinoma antigen recognized by T-cells 3 [Theileria parva strain Muguga]EAN32260.1 Squamous cell carcinoma antigen recognized by T-cells 3 [Theileria parva strain Muguga]|eukprot:XP_764543.1 hypothetical protein [Theileria parva strain Muguga]
MYNRNDIEENNINPYKGESLESIRAKLEEDPWNQDLYTQGMKCASTQNDFESLDYFRREFIKYCIADDTFWLSYLEEKRISTPKPELIKLYELAVKNEPSVYIWLSYLRFVSGNSHTLSDFNHLRALFESSLEVLGLHALDGPQLWSEYRHFEQELISKLPRDQYGAQIDKVRSLFCRQLELPLAGLPDLLDEYLVWESELPSDYRKPTAVAEAAHKRGFEGWEQRKCFELKIQSDFHEMMSRDNMNSLWNEYIDFELKCGDMPRIMITYHRALDDLGFERDDLWINYANYALQTSYQKSLYISERACRHMPRSLNIWINYFLLVSSKSETVQDILDLLQKSTTAVKDVNHRISLHITAADCVRRIDLKDVKNCRYILFKCWSDLDPAFRSRAVYRLLSYWSKYELKLLSFNVPSEYEQAVGKLLERFKNDSFCWLYLIDTVKGLKPENPNMPNIVTTIYKSFCSLVNFKSDFEPTSLHTLVIWLYELAVSVVNVGDVAEEYIDYVQTSGVVEDIKRAHKVVASQSTPTSRPDAISLSNILKRDRRRRKVETFSETSSDSGSFSSIIRRHYSFPPGIRSPTISLNEPERFHRSPKLGFREFELKSPKLYSKDFEHRTNKLTLKDVEILTRATWYGSESADPSIAPPVPPNAPMPPPSSPVLSRITSRLSNSDSCSPDVTPELRSSKEPTLPPPLVLTCESTFNRRDLGPTLPGLDISAKFPESISNLEYKLNFSTADSESLGDRVSSDADSQTDRVNSPITTYSKDPPSLQTSNTLFSSTSELPVPSEFNLSGGHYLLTRKNCIINWLKGDSENSTAFISGFSPDQLPQLTEFFSAMPGFVELRPTKSNRTCYVEFSTNSEALSAVESCKTKFPTLSAQLSKPTKPLFEEKVIFVRMLNSKYNLTKLKLVLTNFFNINGFNVKEIRTTHPFHTDNPDELHRLGFYVEFGFENASKCVIHKFIDEYGWPITINHDQLEFQILPSTPMINRPGSNFPEPQPGSASSHSEVSGSVHREFYLCNLNYSTDETRLREFLESKFGPVKSLKICRDSAGKSKGYAFVEFVNDFVLSDLLKSTLILDDRKLFLSRTNSSQDSLLSEPPKPLTDRHSKNKYKKRYRDYKHRLFETYSKLKKKIKLN